MNPVSTTVARGGMAEEACAMVDEHLEQLHALATRISIALEDDCNGGKNPGPDAPMMAWRLSQVLEGMLESTQIQSALRDFLGMPANGQQLLQAPVHEAHAVPPQMDDFESERTRVAHERIGDDEWVSATVFSPGELASRVRVASKAAGEVDALIRVLCREAARRDRDSLETILPGILQRILALNSVAMSVVGGDDNRPTSDLHEVADADESSGGAT